MGEARRLRSSCHAKSSSDVMVDRRAVTAIPHAFGCQSMLSECHRVSFSVNFKTRGWSIG
jgi:hypothetical protein